MNCILLNPKATFYYFKVMKPKQTSKSTTSLDDLEYDDEDKADEDEYGFDFEDVSDEELEEELND